MQLKKKYKGHIADGWINKTILKQTLSMKPDNDGPGHEQVRGGGSLGSVQVY